MKRSRIRRVSPKRQREALGRAVVRSAVFERDNWQCQFARSDVHCRGPLTVHHLLKASQGGKYSVENGLTLCAQCNDWVEDHPLEAHALGLVVRRGETHEDAAERRVAAGIA